MRILAIIAASLGLSACALTVDKIDVPYQAPANLSVVDGASKAKVAVTAVEGRTVYKDRVSVKKNGYGVEMADIVATNDIPKTIGDAVQNELNSLGYKVGSGGCDLQVQVTRFYSDFKPGFFSADAVAEANANVKLTTPEGKLAYSNYYEAGGIESGVMIYNGENARAALIKAMKNLVAKIINDTDLQKAIISSQPQESSPPTS